MQEHLKGTLIAALTLLPIIALSNAANAESASRAQQYGDDQQLIKRMNKELPKEASESASTSEASGSFYMAGMAETIEEMKAERRMKRLQERRERAARKYINELNKKQVHVEYQSQGGHPPMIYDPSSNKVSGHKREDCDYKDGCTSCLGFDQENMMNDVTDCGKAMMQFGKAACMDSCLPFAMGTISRYYSDSDSDDEIDKAARAMKIHAAKKALLQRRKKPT